jgi:hypothetical protein
MSGAEMWGLDGRWKEIYIIHGRLQEDLRDT